MCQPLFVLIIYLRACKMTANLVRKSLIKGEFVDNTLLHY